MTERVLKGPFVAMLMLTSQSPCVAEVWSLIETKNAYVKVAEFCAADLSETTQQQPAQIDDAKAQAMVKELILDVHAMNNVDPELREIAAELAQSAQQVMGSFNKIQNLPRPPPELLQLAKNLLYLANGEFGEVARHNDVVKSQGTVIQQEVNRFIDAAINLRATSLMLPRIAKKLAGTVTNGSDLLKIDIDEPWGGTGPDRIQLVNHSGRILNNCTIVVRLQGQKGESRENVHFVRRWARNRALYGNYALGETVGGRVVFRETVIGIKRAGVTVLCDEFASDEIDYIYDGAERSRDIAQVLTNTVNLESGYRSFSKGLLWDDKRAVYVILKRPQFLPSGSAFIRASDGQRIVEERRDFQLWRAGERLWFEFPSIDWDPTEWRLELMFPNVDSTAVFRWSRNN